MKNSLTTYLSMAGLVLIMTAVAMPVFHTGRDVITWVYAAGALLVLTGRLMTKAPEGASIKLRRLLRIEVWTAFIFVAGAVFLFLPTAAGSGAGNDWIAFTLAGGILTAYTSIMIPRQR